MKHPVYRYKFEMVDYICLNSHLKITVDQMSVEHSLQIYNTYINKININNHGILSYLNFDQKAKFILRVFEQR